MRETTLDAVRAIIRSDPEVAVGDRARIVAVIRNHGKEAKSPVAPAAEARIMTRAEVARRFGRTTRFVDNLARGGTLRRVTLPGRVRACGFLAADVERVMAGEGGEA